MATKKAVKERKFRQKEQERKHFEGPMRQFIKHKYPLIYEEYKTFYEALTRSHPEARDLTKTRTYKTWVSSLTQQDASDVLACALRQALGQGETSGGHEKFESSTGQTSSDDQNTEASTGQPSIDDENIERSCGQASNDQSTRNLTFTITDEERERETGEATNIILDLNQMVDMMESVDAQVDSIMAELAADQALVDILNQPIEEPTPEDEGIELNPDDDIDIDIDIHPFDFEQEVEPFNW